MMPSTLDGPCGTPDDRGGQQRLANPGRVRDHRTRCARADPAEYHPSDHRRRTAGSYRYLDPISLYIGTLIVM